MNHYKIIIQSNFHFFPYCVIILLSIIHKPIMKGSDYMAKNSGDGYRNSSVSGRSQTYNTKTESYVKRDTSTGRFMNQKTSNNSPFKGVRKER